MRKCQLKFSQISLWIGLLVMLALAGCTPAVFSRPAVEEAPVEVQANDQLRPSPDLSPEEVIKIQVEALQKNDETNRGIEITFRFASPANKQVTGPYNRFVRMVKTPPYRPMLNHRAAVYNPIQISGDTASQRVTITASDGKASVYLFELSKQDLPDCSGCWVTDSVILVPTKPRELKEI